MSRIAVILGSARGDGNTRRAVDRLCEQLRDHPTLIDLSTRVIVPFSYTDLSPGDDFLPIVEQMLAHEQIVFAPPVYWYAMSGLMKTFFDRITDLLQDAGKRSLARSLAGRRVWLLATGSGQDLPPGFDEPFARTADYLDMRWQQAFYARSNGTGALSQVDQMAQCLMVG